MVWATRDDFRYVEDIVTRSKSSFAMGMKILPPDRRGYLFAIYAYCRVLDDIADETDDLSSLDEWQRKIDDVKGQRPSCPITRILCDAVVQFDIPIQELYFLIEGMRMDMEGPVVAPDWDFLYSYCRRVAVSVGLLSLPIFGRTDIGAQEFAKECGYALQFTNILRDLEEDARIGRLYLPREELASAQLNTSPEVVFKNDLTPVLRSLAIKAKEHFKEAHRLLETHGDQNLKPAFMMMAVYEKLFEKIERRGWRKLSPRMRLSTMEKTFLMMKLLAN